VQGGAGRGRTQSFEPEQGIERPLLQSIRKVEENSTPQLFWKLLQGVRARVFFKTRSCEKAQEG
jgi:hypothetical protein